MTPKEIAEKHMHEAFKDAKFEPSAYQSVAQVMANAIQEERERMAKMICPYPPDIVQDGILHGGQDGFTWRSLMTDQQIQILKDLKSDMDECIMATASYSWDDVKHRSCGLFFSDILEWSKKLESVLLKE